MLGALSIAPASATPVVAGAETGSVAVVSRRSPVPLLPSPPQDLTPVRASLLTDPGAGHEATEPQPTPPVAGAPEEGFDPAKSDLVEQTEFSETWLNEDGTKTTELSAEPLNVQLDSGEWVDASTDVLRAAGGGAVAARHPLEPTFAATADSPELFVTRGTDGTSVTFALRGAKSSPIQREGAGVRYDDVLPGADLTYDVLDDGVKESLVLAADPGSDDASWEWEVKTEGLTPRMAEGGRIEFVDGDGVVTLAIPRASMWDSSGVVGEAESAEAVVDTTLESSGTGWVVTQSADSSWLADPARVYPVYIDPSTVGVSPNRVINYKSDGYSCENCGTRIGNSRSSGQDSYYRALVHYDYEQFFGRQIIDAEVHYVTESGTVNLAGGLLHHATAFAYNGFDPNALTSFQVDTEAHIDGGGLGAQLADWVRNGVVGGYFMLRAGEDAGLYTYRSGRTALYVTWNDYANPGVPSNGAPADGAPKASIAPVLSTNASDPNGDELLHLYRVGTTANVEASLVFETPQWTTADRVTVPKGTLNPNTQYFWKKYVHEPGMQGVLSGDTTRLAGPFSFTTQIPLLTPSQAGAQPVDNAVTTSDTPTLSTGPVADAEGAPVKYRFTIATGSDGVSGAVLTSDWLDVSTWTPPAGSLRDGGSYTWSVTVKDSFDITSPTWRNRLRVNQRLGESGPAPVARSGR